VPLEKILKVIPLAVLVVEKNGQVALANDKAIKLYGVDPTDVEILNRANKQMELFTLDNDNYPVEKLPVSQALRGIEADDELIIKRNDGSIIVVNASAKPIQDDKGNVIAAVGIFEDITERKMVDIELRESERRFRLVAEVAKVLVYEITEPQHCIFVFRGEDVLGYTVGEIPNTDEWWLNQIHPEDRAETLRGLRKAIEEGSDYFLEYKIKRKQGDYIFAHDTGKVVKDRNGKVLRFLGGMRDVTERKKSEEALLRSKQQLEAKTAELQEYAKNMEKLAQERAQKLQDAERLAAIGETAGMVGHDIRNPLQAMLGDVYLLKQDLAEMPQSQTKNGVAESLECIETNINYVNKIVADLQDYARKLKPEYAEVDLSELIVSVFKTVAIPDMVKLIIDVNDPIRLETDPTYMQRALTNLVNNAIQAMSNGGELGVRAYKKENSVFIIVSDTGVGIPEEVKPNLFKPLMTTKAKGQGLGLAVVKRLVEGLSGKVTFQSEQGKGTKFVIELPTKA